MEKFGTNWYPFAFWRSLRLFRPPLFFRPFRPGLRDLPGFLLLLALLPNFRALLGDPGVGWHLSAGELMVERGKLLRSDPFLISGGEWINNQWLSDIIFASFFSAGGGFALTVFCIGIAVVVVSVLIPRDEFSVGDFLALVVSSHLLSIQLIVRPVIFSFLLFAVLLKLIQETERRGRTSRAVFIAVPALFFLWAQLHPGFVFGFLLLGIYFIRSAFPDRYSLKIIKPIEIGILLMLGVAATFLNPWGADLHRNILRLANSSFFMNLNTEWLSPDFHQGAFIPLLLTFGVLLFLLPRVRLSRFDTLLIVIFGVLSLYGRRYIPFFGIVLYKPLTELLLGSFQGQINRLLHLRIFPSSGLASVSVAGLLLVWSIFGTPGLALKSTFPPESCPRDAIEAIRREIREAPGSNRIYNHPNHGGCITWSLWPEGLIFIDDRNELNGEDRYREFFNFEKGQHFDRFTFDFAIIRNDTLLSRNLQGDPSWRSIYRDEKESVFQKVSEHR